MPRLTEDALRRYLLRDLPEAEQTEVENELFADESTLQRLSIAEDELIDGYVLGQLSDQERIRLEEYFISSRRLAERVKLAEVLLSRSSLAVRNSAVRSWRNSIAALFKVPHTRPVLVTAIVLVCVASAVASLVAANILRHEFIASLRNMEQSFQRDLMARERQWQQAIEQIRKEQASRAEAPAATAIESAPAQRTSPFFSFLLTSGSVRSIGVSQRLVMPREPHPVRLQLTIQSGERYRSYRVVIRDGDQNQVWSGTLDGDLTANLRVLVVPLPSEVFRPGDYALELSGDPGTGEFAGLEDYAFSVVRK